MKKYIIFLVMLIPMIWACNDEDFLTKVPTTIVSTDVVFSSTGAMDRVIGDLYNRLPDAFGIEGGGDDQNATFMNFGRGSEAILWHFNANYLRSTDIPIDYPYWSGSLFGNFWQNQYSYIRQICLFRERLNASQQSDSIKNLYGAEARFLLAATYFEMVKSLGGVPLITHSLEYDFSGNPDYLKKPRNTEAAIYDYIIGQLDSIKNFLPKNVNIKSRATKGAALAMKSSVALHAASTAKYNALRTPGEQTPGGEVGIPASKANGYYQIALDAAKELINLGTYSLYNKKPDLQDNFAAIFTDKNNPEAIFVKDYMLVKMPEPWTNRNQPSSSVEALGTHTFLNPSLNLAQSFELLDNTLVQFVTNESGHPKYYDNPQDIFANRDARLGATIIYPGSTWKGTPVDIWNGYCKADGTLIISGGTTSDVGYVINGTDTLQHKKVPLVGKDGPVNGSYITTMTGFFIRKYMDPTPGSGTSVGSNVWWIYYRYAEVLLNAAEAAFELGDPTAAAGYMNQVRARAGLIIPLTPADITFDRIVHERKVELAFEGHELWDMKRWRLAHIVWDGTQITVVTTTPGKADAVSSRNICLFPYKVFEPSNPAANGKYIFKQILFSGYTGYTKWNLYNYYARIPDNIIANNINIVQNPY